MSYGWGVHECIWTLFEGDCTTTTTTSRPTPDYSDYDMGNEQEVSTGFHIIEIHSRTVGFTLTTLLLLLGLALLLFCCYRRFCGTANLCPPAQPQPQPNAYEMQPLPFHVGQAQHYAQHYWPTHPPPNVPSIYYDRQVSTPPAYEFDTPRRQRQNSPPRIVTLERSPRPARRHATPSPTRNQASAPPENL